MAEDDENIYNDEARKELVADDEMSSNEEAFMKGYDDAEEDEDSTEEESDLDPNSV